MMDERKDARTDGRTWATLNALPHSTNSGGIKKKKKCTNRGNTKGVWTPLHNTTSSTQYLYQLSREIVGGNILSDNNFERKYNWHVKGMICS